MAKTPTRTEIAANWKTSNTLLTVGEVVIESDTGIIRVGDGVTAYNKLAIADKQVTADNSLITNPIIVGGSATSLYLITPLFSVTDAIVASATQTQAAATPLTTRISRVVTVASAGNAVRLPTTIAGKIMTVTNSHPTNSLNIFPATGDAINALSANTVYSLAAAKSAEFYCAVFGTWNTILSA